MEYDNQYIIEIESEMKKTTALLFQKDGWSSSHALTEFKLYRETLVNIKKLEKGHRGSKSNYNTLRKMRL